MAGSTITVDWTGSANENDQIVTTTPGQTHTLTFLGTDTGNPAALRMPPTAGTYDILYLMWPGHKRGLGLHIHRAIATLSAPDAGIIGTQINIIWTRPDYPGDMIVIGQVGGISNQPTTDQHRQPDDNETAQ